MNNELKVNYEKNFQNDPKEIVPLFLSLKNFLVALLGVSSKIRLLTG
jgi:hypothetical protein